MHTKRPGFKQTATVFANKNVLVLGAGVSGIAATKLAHALGAKVTLLEKNPAAFSDTFQDWAKTANVTLVTGSLEQEYFIDTNYVIPSPGIAVSTLEPFLTQCSPRPEVLGEIELGFRCLGNEPIVALTGTSGKTTTVNLMAAMFKSAGQRCFLGGNIGIPLCNYVLDVLQGIPQVQVIILEISSFQLQTCSTFCPNIGIINNISENHLDYHASMKEYVAAKLNIFASQTATDIALIDQSVAQWVSLASFRGKASYLPRIHPFTKVLLPGEHNGRNIAAAWYVCSLLGVTTEQAALAVASFASQAHRLEVLGEYNGILYVNDSKSTTAASQQVALQAFNRPIWLLAGGKFKGGDLAKTRKFLKGKVKGVCLYGASQEAFKEAWENTVPITYDETMAQAFQRAQSNAVVGDVILLSPATASYDQFKDYIERGEAFRSLVEQVE